MSTLKPPFDALLSDMLGPDPLPEARDVRQPTSHQWGTPAWLAAMVPAA